MKIKVILTIKISAVFQLKKCCQRSKSRIKQKLTSIVQIYSRVHQIDNKLDIRQNINKHKEWLTIKK
jgi:glutaredoxin-related protein